MHNRVANTDASRVIDVYVWGMVCVCVRVCVRLITAKVVQFLYQLVRLSLSAMDCCTYYTTRGDKRSSNV